MCRSAHLCTCRSAFYSKCDLQICTGEGFFLFMVALGVCGFFIVGWGGHCKVIGCVAVLVLRPEGAGVILTENTEQ